MVLAQPADAAATAALRAPASLAFAAAKKLSCDGSRRDIRGDFLADGEHQAFDLLEIDGVDQRIVVARHHARALEDEEPVEIGERLGALLHDAPGGAIQVEAVSDAVRPRALRILLPERRVIAPRGAVVQDDEVTHAFEVTDDRRVVARRDGGVKLLVRKMVEQIEQRAAQQVQVARRQRLEASGRRAQRNHVLVPEHAATTVRERHQARLGEQRPGGGGQFLARGFFVLVRARPDLAGSGHRLQRHAPLPARGARVEAHARRARVFERGRSGQQPIAGQPLLPVLERRLENLADELGARAAGVDEQVGAQAAAVLELQLLEQPVFAARRTNYLALQADHAGALGDAAQVARRERAVQVQRVAHVLRHAQRVGGEDEAVGERHRGLEAEQLEPGFQAQGARLVPVVIERPALDQCAEGADVDASLPRPAPTSRRDGRRGCRCSGSCR